MLASSGNVGNDATTEKIVTAIDSIHSFPIVLGVIESLPIDSVDSLVDGKCLVKGDVVGIVIEGRVGCQEGSGESE
jgi:hypothetical protein